eukprot:m.55716 g.55716  ORF g.55716 m.55716 type:complete len:104 (+) comp11511_c0_seq1:3205-3516(+)
MLPWLLPRSMLNSSLLDSRQRKRQALQSLNAPLLRFVSVLLLTTTIKGNKRLRPHPRSRTRDDTHTHKHDCCSFSSCVFILIVGIQSFTSLHAFSCTVPVNFN